jgi:RNA-directed DNA polymerase
MGVERRERRKMDGVTNGLRQTTPVPVPEKAKQTGEVRARWAWTEAAVWTERMLTALETGVKGGPWFSLIDKVYAMPALRSAFARVKANDGAAGVDHQTIAMYEAELEVNLEKLAQTLREGTYQPQAVKRVWIPKPGGTEQRPLGIPTVRDRVVQTALRAVLEPIFERDFAEHSYGFRPGRGCKDALRRVDHLLKNGCTWVVDADLKSYFDTIPHAPLMRRVCEKVADGRVLRLIEAFLTQGVMDGLSGWTPSAGSPQGAVISPLLSNAYLDPLDREMAAAGVEMVRYADDFVLLCRSEEQAREALERVRRWTAQAGLTLHPEKTRIVNATEDGFEFLGYRFEQGRKRPRAKSLQKFKDKVRSQTSRLNGQSLQETIANVNRTLRGWFAYFKHSHKHAFPPLDSWVRTRLRRILRRRRGRSRGRVRGADQFRWPNAFFASRGLFSLVAAHALACQSVRR